MNKTAEIRSFENKHPITVNYLVPRICPCCDYACNPEIVSGHYVLIRDSVASVYMTFFCNNCEKMFFVTYTAQKDMYGDTFKSTFIQNIYPQKIKTKTFPEHINNLSKNFVKIYNQSYQAENYGLLHICGMGYRKSLEFLIKDYLINKYPSHEEEIKGKLLSKCINDYLCKDKDNLFQQDIKTLAEKSAWIGNDETHYIRKHPDKDFNDLKNFIDVLVSYINAQLLIEEAKNMIPK